MLRHNLRSTHNCARFVDGFLLTVVFRDRLLHSFVDGLMLTVIFCDRLLHSFVDGLMLTVIFCDRVSSRLFLSRKTEETKLTDSLGKPETDRYFARLAFYSIPTGFSQPWISLMHGDVRRRPELCEGKEV